MADAEPLAAELFHGIIAFIADDSDFALDGAAAAATIVFVVIVQAPWGDGEWEA